MERNLKLTIEYEGARYHGWQIQPNGVSIQEKLEEALARLTGRRPRVIGSGRTDAGVHAEAQVAHFKTESAMECRSLLRGLNALLPDDIVICQVEEAPADFHARHSARGKSYRYVILNRGYPSAFERKRCWQVSCPLDLDAMRQAAALMVGRRDFSAFQASDCGARHSMREVRGIDIDDREGWITIRVSGDAFLKHMVRNMVGTLVEVGRGKMVAAAVKGILESRDRTRAGPTAPSRGLFLVSVSYGERMNGGDSAAPSGPGSEKVFP
jgi:tRNA pseudouridine38-40 synthase